MLAFIGNLRRGKPTHFVIYDEIWDLPWVQEPDFLYKPYHHQHDIDPEQAIHSPELYAIWNSKPWMLSHATEINPFESQYFFWMDMGCVRDPTRVISSAFPDVKRVVSVFGEDER